MTNRIDQHKLEWIDREQAIEIEFEGKKYQGFAGDTISSLLLSNDLPYLGRSFKYHRPRGPLSFANHDINALVETSHQTNIRADITPAKDGEQYFATNTLGGLKNDRRKLLGKFSSFLPVGFYYKAFFKPRFLFPMWERIIRRAAGLGRVNLEWQAERVAKRYGFCDVLVIGAGPAGMSAALAAADQGVQVMLVDENQEIGGSLDYQYAFDSEVESQRLDLKQRVKAHNKIELLLNAEASAYYHDRWVPVTTPTGIVKVRSKTIVMATGAQEQPAVFHNNDIPGVMLASAAQRMINRYALAPCKKVVLLVANEEGYRVARDCVETGIEVVAIVDLNEHEVPAEQRALLSKDITIYQHHAIYEAHAQADRLAKVTICPLDDENECNPGLAKELECDGVLMSVGWVPSTQMMYQAGATIRYDDQLNQFVPIELPDNMYAAGRVNGVYELQAQFKDGEAAGQQAAAKSRAQESSITPPARTSISHSHPYPVFAHPKGKNFVDMDEDLQLNDLINAASEGFDNIELIKRYSTIGMGPSQGKHANMNGIRILARLRGLSIDETGSTTARPMFHPVPINALAGRRFRPERLTPMHQFHLEHNAVMMEAGPWLRPEYYQLETTRLDCIQAEARQVRNAVGIIDVSTLGKIEAFGPDVAELMNRLFTMRMDNIAVGMTRYALMVDESGVIIDDGVAARYSDQHYYFSTTTTTSDSAYRMIQRYIIEWNLDVTVVNRTGQLAAMNLAGPKSRELLSTLCGIDLSEESFPYLGARRGLVLGKEATLLRVGFVGELGYEIHLRASDAAEVWQGLISAGEQYNIRPFGVEAQRLLRLEKGHIIIGQDTDGLSNPFHASMGWAAHMKKDFFIGQRSLEIVKPRHERKLFGFSLPAEQNNMPKECHLLIKDGEINGRVTSVLYSPVMERVIGLAYVEDEQAKVGDEITIKIDGAELITAKLVKLPFYDPEGARQTIDLDQPLAPEATA